MTERHESRDGDPFDCENADAVLAHFLDGAELQSLDYVERESIVEHLGSCKICDGALSRARKLDAQIAAGSRKLIETPGPKTVDEWFLNAFVEEESEAGDVEIDEAVDSSEAVVSSLWSGRSRVTLVALAAVLMVGVIGLLTVGYALGRADEEARAPLDAGSPVAHADGEGTEDPEQGGQKEAGGSETAGGSEAVASRVRTDRPGVTDVLVEDPGKRRSFDRRGSLTELDLAAAVEHPLTPILDRGVRALGAELAALVGRPAIQETVDGVLDRSLDRAVARLSNTRGRAAEDALFVLAVRDGNETARSVLEGRMRSWLRRVPADRRARRLAAEFGGRRADRELLEWALGDAGRSDELSNDLRVAGDRPGTVALLLELWRGLDRLGGSPAQTIAERWFSGRGDRCAEQAVALLEGSLNAEQRRRLLLACAAMRSSVASQALQERLTSGHREEALLAAYALGRLPVRSDGLIDLDPRRRDLALWRTALISRRDPIAETWLEQLSLPREQMAMLRGGGFSLEQIPAVVRLLEENGLGARGRRGY